MAIFFFKSPSKGSGEKCAGGSKCLHFGPKLPFQDTKFQLGLLVGAYHLLFPPVKVKLCVSMVICLANVIITKNQIGSKSTAKHPAQEIYFSKLWLVVGHLPPMEA
jgi:hypothetical protein